MNRDPLQVILWIVAVFLIVAFLFWFLRQLDAESVDAMSAAFLAPAGLG